MLIPVRCFTCGKIVGNKWNNYVDKISQGFDKDEILSELGLKRTCCRSMLLNHINLIDKLMLQKEIEDNENEIGAVQMEIV